MSTYQSEYYYDLEAALAFRSEYSEDISDLDKFKLDETKDLFVLALCYKYGINCIKDIEGSVKLLNELEISNPELKKFIYYQLSDYYMKNTSVAGKIATSKLREVYFQSAIDHGHRVAMQEQAALLLDFGSGSCENEERAIALCETALSLGNTDCVDLLIECYMRTKKYKKACELLSKYLKPKDQIALINNIIKCQPLEINELIMQLFLSLSVNTALEFLSGYITTEMIIELLRLVKNNEQSFLDKNILPKILYIFNHNTVLFENFIYHVSNANVLHNKS